MKPNEMSLIRTKLRAVNVEYSSLVKQKAGDGRFARMGELTSERRALMAQLAGRAHLNGIVCVPGQVRPEVANHNAPS